MPLLLHLRGQGWDAIRLDDLCRGQDQDIGEARKILGPGQCLFGNMSAYSLLRGEWKDISARTLYQYEAAGKEGAFIISSGSGICDQTDPAIIDRWLSYARSLSGQGG
jgi:uroporphyrinogen-III decarboxylase